MPVVKVPIQHRFGVISEKQRTQLQEVILQEISAQESQVAAERFSDPIEKCENLVRRIKSLQEKTFNLQRKLQKVASERQSRTSTAISQLSRPVTADSSWSDTIPNALHLDETATHGENQQPPNSADGGFRQPVGEKNESADVTRENSAGTKASSTHGEIAMMQMQKQQASEDLEEALDHACTLIERAKRRSGILSGGSGEHVNLTLSWTELAILNRVHDEKIKRECLRVLATSLSSAPLTNDRIVFTGRLHSLVFVAQSLLFWLNNILEAGSSALTLAEISCLRVLYFLFLRLWTYVTLGILTNERHHAQLQNLLKYVCALDDKALPLYRNYPDAAYCVKVILEIRDELQRVTKARSGNSSGNRQTSTVTHAVVMDELLIDDVNVDAKLIRDITPSLYQCIDLFRRSSHGLTPEDWRLFSKSLEMDDKTQETMRDYAISGSAERFPLMDKLFTLGIISVLAVNDRTALEVFQERIDGQKMKNRDWTENYLSTQMQTLICLQGRTSKIKRAALVTDKRGTEEAVDLCEQNFRPRHSMPNLGGLIDLLSYAPTDSASSWIVQAAALSGMIRVEKHFDKSDPMRLAIFNLVRAHFSLSEQGKLDSRVVDSIHLAKATAESNTAVLNDVKIWRRCAELFCETLLPDMSLTKTLNESKIMEEAKIKAKPLKNRKSQPPRKTSEQFRTEMSAEKNNNKKLRKEHDYGQKKFAKREDGKLKNMVNTVWDDQLYNELESEISMLVDNMSHSKL